jgi:carboxyl-terminal processing protease
LKVTIQKFYRIAGGSTQLKGVVPDVILPSYSDEIETGEASLPNALEYDTIPKLTYDETGNGALTDKLRTASEARIASAKEYKYLLDDNQRIKVLTKRNAVSLNLEKRLAENKSDKDRRRSRNADRLKRFEGIEQAEKGRYSVYRITLDNVDDEKLKALDNFKQDDASSMIRAENKEKELAETVPNYPHFLAPAKREALDIASDLITTTKALRTARTSPSKPATGS